MKGVKQGNKGRRMRKTYRNHKHVEEIINDVVVYDADTVKLDEVEQVFLAKYVDALRSGERVYASRIAAQVKPDIDLASAACWASRVLNKINRDMTIKNAMEAVGVNSLHLANKLREGMDANDKLVTKEGVVLERVNWQARHAHLNLALRVTGDLQDRAAVNNNINLDVREYVVNLPEKSATGDFTGMRPVIPENAVEVHGITPENKNGHSNGVAAGGNGKH